MVTNPAPHVPLERGSHIIFIDKPYAVLLDDDAMGITVSEFSGASKAPAMKSSSHTGCVKIALQLSGAVVTVRPVELVKLKCVLYGYRLPCTHRGHTWEESPGPASQTGHG